MSRRITVTEAEIKRAMRAAMALGLVVSAVRIGDGKVELVVGEGQTLDVAPDSALNEWDEVLQ